MSWYDPSSWDWSGTFGVGSGDPSNPDRQNVRQTGNNFSDFGDQARAGYGNMTGQLGNQTQFLQGIQSGQNSISGEQLRQGLQQQLGQQQAMAASANPNNQAMAARNAAMNMGQASYGMSGQAALAGLQERRDANNQLNQLLLQQRGQDLQGTLGGYGGAAGAYGSAMGNPQKNAGSLIGGAIGGAAGVLGSYLGGPKSDRRAKSDISKGDAKADRVLAGLKAYEYRYKDPRDGQGKRLGIMAQDLERAGLKHTVVNAPDGKRIDGGQLSTANTALIAALGNRVSKLEKKR